MMQAWLVVEFGVADLDVCLLSRVRCGNRGETKEAKTTHRRLCNRGISQHRAANHSFHLLSSQHILTSPSPRGLSFRMSLQRVWSYLKFLKANVFDRISEWRYRNSMVCRYNVVIKPVCQLGNNLIEINFLKIGSHKSQPARLSNGPPEKLKDYSIQQCN